jgi:DNA-binding FrmR family transcriptional regulator
MQCDKKEFKDRIHRISGQISALETMYEDKRTAREVLQQLIAVRSSLSSLAKLVVEEEVKGCLPGDEKGQPISHLVDTLFKVT